LNQADYHSDCTDPKLGRKLYAFELGQLQGDERIELETHLLECDACYQRARSFLPYAELIQNESEVRSTLEKIARDQEGKATPAGLVWYRRWKLPLAVAAVLVILLLKPWDITIQTDNVVLARQNLMAIMHFGNLVEPDSVGRKGEIVTDLLINDLSESGYMTVLSGQRLYDILQSLGHPGAKQIEPEVARQVAQKANAQWLLTGNILQVEPYLVITAQVSDAHSGAVIAAQRVDGQPQDDIFAVVDELTVAIKADLDLPDEAIDEYDPEARSITTSSPEAYRHYLAGMDWYYQYNFKEAEASFLKAADIDSTFALAYYRLYQCGQNPDQYLSAAMHYQDNVNDLYRRFIQAAHEWRQENFSEAIAIYHQIAEKYPNEKEIHEYLGRIYNTMRRRDEAIASFRRVIELDPLYKRAYNSLVYLYRDSHRHEDALWAINKYIELAPDEPRPHITRGILYAHTGQLRKAIESYQRALAIQPDDYMAYEKLGDAYMFMHDFGKADSIYREGALVVSGDPYFLLSRIARYRGRFHEALELLQKHIEAQRESQDGYYAEAWSRMFKCAIYDLYLQEPEAALREAVIADSLFASVSVNLHDLQNMKGAVMLAFEAGGDHHRADSILGIIYELSQQAEIPQDERYAWFRGELALRRGQLDTAAHYLQVAYELMPRFPEHYALANTYYLSGRLADAVKAYEILLNRYDFLHANWTDWSAQAHYQLGLAYEDSGWRDRAIEQYRIFLDLWSEADIKFPQIDDARNRLNGLESNP